MTSMTNNYPVKETNGALTNNNCTRRKYCWGVTGGLVLVIAICADVSSSLTNVNAFFTYLPQTQFQTRIGLATNHRFFCGRQTSTSTSTSTIRRRQRTGYGYQFAANDDSSQVSVSTTSATNATIGSPHTNTNTNANSSPNSRSSSPLDTSVTPSSSSSATTRRATTRIKASRKPLPYPVRIAVLGGGNFGLGLSTVFARKGIPTTILVRSDKTADYINRHHRHPTYMNDIQLPPSVMATSSPQVALADATYIVHTVPVQFTREFLNEIKEFVPANVPVMAASKGIETTSLGFMTDILGETIGTERTYAFLSGPSFAREICEGLATAVVIASDDIHLADDLADLMSDESFRCFTSRDVIGVEVGGAVKNVIALAAGMCEGLGLGTNAMSGLVTRGCGEMRRLGLHLGAQASTLSGLSGVGDTFGTCFGPLSRNRQFGFRLGQGETMEEILKSTNEVAEGVATSLALVRFLREKVGGYRLDLKYPILFGVANILEGKQTPAEGLTGLMEMPMRLENYDERQME